MKCSPFMTGCLLALMALGPIGCRSRDTFDFDPDLHEYQTFATQIEYPDIETPPREDLVTSQPPNTIRDEREMTYWDISLQEVMRRALANSQVIRDLGGFVVSNPQGATTVYDVAIRDTNPVSGPEAALSQFDALFATGLFFNRDDLAFNNTFFGGGARVLNQHTAQHTVGISKTAATGTQFALRNTIDYTRNNATFNLFPGAYNTVLEGEVRHPLLQGSGILFNRIAGPRSAPGVYNGVLLGRIDTDTQIAVFEIQVRDFLREVERAYWELFFAYQDFHARVVLRDSALGLWKIAESRYRGGVERAVNEARVREQYYLAKASAENALNGTPTGVSATTPSAVAAGVFALERRLRFLMGLPPNGGQLLRPADEPTKADIYFEWYESLASSMTRRAELRRQKWIMRRRELELIASRNFLKMRFDLVGQYRWRGFGDNLLGNDFTPSNSAFESLFTDDLEGWRLGAELTTPVGNRIGHNAVRNAELLLTREHAIHRTQELQISHELSNAMAELARAYEVSHSNYNRSIAAHDIEEQEQRFVDVGEKISRDLLDAQRQRAEADVAFQRSLVDYTLSISNVHFARGTLLDYYGVELNEGSWSEEAHYSAAKQSRRFRPSLLNYCIETPCAISRGAYPQHTNDNVIQRPVPVQRVDRLPPAEEKDAMDNGEFDNGEFDNGEFDNGEMDNSDRMNGDSEDGLRGEEAFLRNNGDNATMAPPIVRPAQRFDYRGTIRR